MRIVAAFFFASLASCSHSSDLPNSSAPIDAVEVDLCDVIENSNEYIGQLIAFDGYMVARFPALRSTGCEGFLPTRKGGLDAEHEEQLARSMAVGIYSYDLGIFARYRARVEAPDEQYAVPGAVITTFDDMRVEVIKP